MLQAPTNDRKTKAEASSKTAEYLPEYEQSSQLMGGIERSRQSQPLQQRENLAALQKAYGNQAVLRMKGRSTTANSVQRGVLQRKCACGNTAGSSGSCAECQSKQEGILQTKLQIGEAGDQYEQEADRVADRVMRMPEPTIQDSGKEDVVQRNSITPLQMRSTDQAQPSEVPPIVNEVINSPGQPLDNEIRTFMEPRFGHDLSGVRIHTNTNAASSARAVNALAYTVGRNVVFASEQYAPTTGSGRHLLAHELTHVIQQGANKSSVTRTNLTNDSSSKESVGVVTEAAGQIAPMLQRRAAPYIKKITVHLAPPQTADLEWQGTPPASATGSDHFTVSTGKGYSDPGDPPGTCTRTCCSDAMTQCAPPWNQPGRVGACCTYYGNNFWTGIPLDEHNGWKWWTPIQPYYSSRGIALHQHSTVTGQPIGHGCVRMEEPNAKRIYDFSNGRRTNVTIDGRAAPVACGASQQCSSGSSSSTGSGASGQLDEDLSDARIASENEAIPGLEGEMS